MQYLRINFSETDDSIKFQQAFANGYLAQGIPVTSPDFYPRDYQIEVGLPGHKLDFELGPMNREEERLLSPSGSPLAAKQLSPEIGPSSSMEATDIFNKSILVENAQSEFQSATALLDTQCQHGNWISNRLVERLGRQEYVRQEKETLNVQDVNGQEVHSLGTIKLSWKWNSRSRVYDADFHVFNSEHFDILFGVQYIVAKGMVTFNSGETDVIAPLVSHTKIKASEKAAIALRKEKQKQEKAARDAEKAAKASQKKGSSGSSGQVKTKQPDN